MKSVNKVSFIIPAYNESERIVKTLDDLNQYFKFFNYDFEVIFVNDGSSDGTENIIQKYISDNSLRKFKLLNISDNQGKGAAVKFGMLNAATDSDLYFFMDADLSTPLFEIDKFIKKYLSSEAEVLIASRSLSASNVLKRQNRLRESMGRIFNKFVKVLMRSEFIDTQCGFKMFAKTAKDKIFSKLRIKRFSFDVEILMISKKNKIEICDLPVTWINNPVSKVKIIRDSCKMFIDIFFKIQFLQRKIQ